MVIENMQQALDLLKNIKEFFYNIDETEKKLNTELYNKEGGLKIWILEKFKKHKK